MINKKIYTVVELTQTIKNLITQSIGNVWLCGEISNLKYASSGHVYMTLKDDKAQIKTVVFRSTNNSLKFKLENGQQVLVSGQVSVYEKSGEYQIIANYIEPAGIGTLQLAFEQLKEKLEKQGLFDKSRKKQIPYMPSKIGIVTSPTGAAIQDMLNVTKRRCPFISIIVNPVKVQGQGSAEEIADAVNLFNKFNSVDVIIIGRGGGSIEDLWAFNEEIVARAVADSKIPVVSAVGHETDFTISDFVADLRAPTPSAAAELVCPDILELRKRILVLNKDLYTIVISKIERHKARIKQLLSHYVFKEPQGAIKFYIQTVDDCVFRLKNYMKICLTKYNSDFRILSDKLDVLSPLKIISRGYSVAVDTKNNKVIKNIFDVKENNEIKTIFKDGFVVSKVKEVVECKGVLQGAAIDEAV